MIYILVYLLIGSLITLAFDKMLRYKAIPEYLDANPDIFEENPEATPELVHKVFMAIICSFFVLAWPVVVFKIIQGCIRYLKRRAIDERKKDKTRRRD